jgi:REP element-mobilizing transposase RayT
MSSGYQIIEQDAPYFLTFQVVKWIDVFTRKKYKDIVIDSLIYCQKHKELEIYAYVLMSNHIHILMRSNISKLSDTIREFKSFTARQILQEMESESESRRKWMLNIFEFSAKQHKRNENHQLWTHENHAELIYSNHFLKQKIHYIHDNPVRAGIVEKAEDYIYSSAGFYGGKDGLLQVNDLILPI